ncbi:MAG TPA: cell division protein FtsA, partial [Flavobacterium sp.]|nr:cell division protein FtsA [Flavobacterium sp.]
LTGGGANLKHIKQLVEYITGMDTRIGYPNEHLAGNSDEEISSPLYATAVGLVMNSIGNKTQSAVKMDAEPIAAPIIIQKPVVEQFYEKPVETEVETKVEVSVNSKETETTETKIRRSFFDKYVDKIKDFLDNAE